jgi:hypothetical protein
VYMCVCVRCPLVCSLALDGLGLGVETEFLLKRILVSGWLTA